MFSFIASSMGIIGILWIAVAYDWDGVFNSEPFSSPPLAFSGVTILLLTIFGFHDPFGILGWIQSQISFGSVAAYLVGGCIYAVFYWRFFVLPQLYEGVEYIKGRIDKEILIETEHDMTPDQQVVYCYPNLFYLDEDGVSVLPRLSRYIGDEVGFWIGLVLRWPFNLIKRIVKNHFVLKVWKNVSEFLFDELVRMKSSRK